MKEYKFLTSWNLEELAQKMNSCAKEKWRVIHFLDQDDWGDYHVLMERDITAA